MGTQKSKCQILAKFSLGVGGGYSLVVKTQSAKFWPSFHFRGEGVWPTIHGGEVFLGSENSKYQVLANFSLGRGVLRFSRIRYSWQNEPNILEA